MNASSQTLTIRPALAWLLVVVATCGFIAAFISLQAGFFALLFSGIAWYVWRYPEEGFLLLLVMLPILPMLKITQTIGTFSLVKDVIILTLFLKLFVLPLILRRLPYRRNIVLAPIIALCIWATIAALRADSYIFGAVLLRDIGLYVLAYFAVLYLPKHDEVTMKRRLMWVLMAVGVTILLSIWQWIGAQDSAVLRFDPVGKIWIPRISSILAHPSIYGQYLTAALTLLGGVALVVTEKRSRIATIIGVLILLPLIFLTYSRGVWMAVAAAGISMAAVYVWKIIKAKTSIKAVGTYGLGALIVVAGLLIVVANTTPAGGLLRSIFDPTYASNEERVVFLTRLVAPLSNTQAIVGVGLGNIVQQNFREVNLEAIDIASAASRTVQLAKNKTLVDNQHLKTFIEMGLIGILVFGWLYFRIAREAVRAALSQTSRLTQILGFASIGFLVAFILQGFLIDIWNIFPTNLIFWIFAALLSQVVTVYVSAKKS